MTMEKPISDILRNIPIRGIANRRDVLALLAGAATVLLPVAGLASPAEAIGTVTTLRGSATALRKADLLDLSIGADLMLKDLFKTAESSSTTLLFGDHTSIRLGDRTELMIDSFLLNTQGSFDLMQGAMVFERPEDAPKTPVTVKTVFGQLGVRGTRFFAGPSAGVFGVFVERGLLEVSAAGVERRLQAGEGIDIPESGSAPGQVTRWAPDRIRQAFASVGL
tara:strand:- start:20818 stop:21483 length:666 start_codon:yes stop_codon:yes gene_type:complete